jgi:hypothetical protein
MRRPTLAGGGLLLFAGVTFALLMAIPVATQEPGPRFSDWGPATPLGAPFTGVGQQQGCPFISKDDLNLYFRARVLKAGTLNRDWDIFVSHRESVDDAWGTPVNLGSEINPTTPMGSNATGPVYSSELCSFLTIDGHWLYFVSNRPGGYGGNDLWVSHRKDKDDPTGWETPTNLGGVVNTSAGETGPSIFEDEASGKTIMYFTSGTKIMQTVLLDKDSPGSVSEVPVLNAPASTNMHAFVRRKDGLEVVFVSDRTTHYWWDLWTSTRPTTSSPWSAPVRLGVQVDPLDPPGDEARPSISWDGNTLYFWSDREGAPNWFLRLYKSERTKITGRK